ncbi:MAG TPA: TIGR03118 family protein [Solirubrobacteraceae bacterium]|nr:TIGR03118 family protein [Solirubrobacteraceae bacterium]
MRASRLISIPARPRRWYALAAVASAALAAAALPGAAAARSHPQRHGLAGYHQRNLVADTPGHAEVTDPNLVNAWGLSFGPNTPAWVADNGTGLSTLYSGASASVKGVTTVPLVVKIPQGAPTGTVFNGGAGFKIDGSPSAFLFSSEAGVISGWNPAFGTDARVGASAMGAVYKGLAIASTPEGQRLYATDFHGNRVDVWNDTFAPAGKPGAFTDPNVPKGFAPFGIQTVGGRIVVTYAKQDADAMDDVHGAGLGFVDLYDTSGTLIKRLVSRGPLNAPWGIAQAPKHFGKASKDLLIGNFGDGRINAFNPKNGRFEGALRKGKRGPRVTIDGLWALEFGNGTIGTPQTLLFTAGPGDESHGLFGAITATKGGGR